MNGGFTVYHCRCEAGDSSHGLLSRAAMLHIGCGSAPVLETDPLGKPHFPEYPEVFFSLTHSGTYWMCAFGSEPVGLDLQLHQNCAREKISRRYFHPDEDAFLKEGNYEQFFHIWAAKESYLKYTGQGMHRPLSGFSVVFGGSLAAGTEGALFRFLPFQPDYSLCLCARRIGDVAMVGGWPKR